MRTFTIFGYKPFSLSVILIGRVVLSQITTPSPSTSSLPTSISSSPKTFTTDYMPASLKCLAYLRCTERISEFLDPKCGYGTECTCVAQNSTGYQDCLKEKCPNDWETIHADDVMACSKFGVDLSGNTTYTGIPLPTVTGFNTSSWGTGEDGRLSQSDKIAIGIGVGFGVPTIAVGLGAWLCVRRRGAARDRGGEGSK